MLNTAQIIVLNYVIGSNLLSYHPVNFTVFENLGKVTIKMHQETIMNIA
jgi:hypothetical protein